MYQFLTLEYFIYLRYSQDKYDLPRMKAVSTYKCWSTSTRLYDEMFQKAIILTVIFFYLSIIGKFMIIL